MSPYKETETLKKSSIIGFAVNMFKLIQGNKNAEYLCSECNFKLSNQTKANQHLNFHRCLSLPKCSNQKYDSLVPSCKICLKKPKTLKELLEHCWSDHGTPYSNNRKCPFCGEVFERYSRMLEHMDVDCVYFKCLKCSQVMNQQHVFYIHNSSCLVGGNSSRFDVSCEICSKQMLAQDVPLHLIQHSLTMISGSESGSKDKSGKKCGADKDKLSGNALDRMFLCEVCDDIRTTKEDYHRHMINHLDLMNPPKSNTTSSLKCNICGLMGFLHLGHLVRHHILRCQKNPQQMQFYHEIIKFAKGHKLSFTETLQHQNFQKYLDFGINIFSAKPIVSQYLTSIKMGSVADISNRNFKDFNDIDLFQILDKNLGVKKNAWIKEDEIIADPLVTPDQKLIPTEEDIQSFLKYLRRSKELADQTSAKRPPVSKSELVNYPGVHLLPEPDIDRLLYFSRLIQEQCNSRNALSSIPDELLTRLNVESQVLREIEPFYLAANNVEDQATTVEESSEINDLVKFYSNQNVVMDEIDKAENWLYS